MKRSNDQKDNTTEKKLEINNLRMCVYAYASRTSMVKSMRSGDAWNRHNKYCSLRQDSDKQQKVTL